MNVTVDMSELSELAQILINEAPMQAIGAARKVTTAEARKVKARAQAAAPRDRPWLAGAIRQKTWTNPESVAASVFVEGADPEGRAVAFYVEYGTSKAAPQPFMGPAIASSHESYPPAVLAKIDPFGSPGGGGGE